MSGRRADVLLILSQEGRLFHACTVCSRLSPRRDDSWRAAPAPPADVARGRASCIRCRLCRHGPGCRRRPRPRISCWRNGMEVVVVPNHRVPVVTHQVWYKAGGAEDPDDQPGIAHFLEHLMFKGTKSFPGNSFERFVVANGGAGTNAFTYQDVTVYPQTLPKKHLAALMEREADRMVNLVITDEQVKAEVGVVQNERRGNDNSPGYLAGRAHQSRAVSRPSLQPVDHRHRGGDCHARPGQGACLLQALLRAQQRRSGGGGRRDGGRGAQARREHLRAHPRQQGPAEARRAAAAQEARHHARRYGSRARGDAVGRLLLHDARRRRPVASRRQRARACSSTSPARASSAVSTVRSSPIRSWPPISPRAIGTTCAEASSPSARRAAPGVSVADLEAALGREIAALGATA